jgi:uncharacterized membrane protein YhaH (DUF805 family)
MDKYIYFLKKPFSFRGRITRLEYLISILITPIFSLIAILIVLLFFNGLEVYPKPSSLILAEKEYQVAEVANDKNNALFDVGGYKEEISTEYVEAQLHLQNEHSNHEFNKSDLSILFWIILNIPIALFLIASGTKRSHDTGDSGILQIILPIYIFILILKKSEKKDNIYGLYILPEIKAEKNKTNNENLIPEVCPNCKNPNTNRSTICEWCGNQIA